MVVLQCKKSPPKKRGESLKKEISSFLGNVGLIKVVFEFPFAFFGTFAKSGHFRVQKNGTLSAQTKILRPLLLVQHPPKLMELTLVLSVYHFWRGFQPFQNM